MEFLCHRCGNALKEGSVFCAYCGAPQLVFEPSTEASGEVTPGRTASQALVNRGIQWKTALTSAVMIAVPVALLTMISSLFLVWVIGGGIAVVALYRRRAAALVINSRVGFRIGLVMGVLSSFLTMAISAGSAIFFRFVMHDGARIDSFFQTILDQGTLQASQSTPDAAAQMLEMMRFFGTADGKAGLVMAFSAMIVGSMMAFSAMGGALGARIFAPRGRSLHNP